jgi:hypothetical protein
VRVVWPDGRQLTLHGIDADRTLVVTPHDPQDLLAARPGCAL